MNSAQRPLQPDPDEDAEESPKSRLALVSIRYLLPGAAIIGGIVVMALGGESNLEGGGGIVSAGLAIWLTNWLFRAGASGDRERDAEERAREYLDRHGRWPD